MAHRGKWALIALGVCLAGGARAQDVAVSRQLHASAKARKRSEAKPPPSPSAEEQARRDEELRAEQERAARQREGEARRAKEAADAKAAAAAPAPQERKVQIAAPGFSAHGLPASAGDFYADQVSQQLSFHGVSVVTRSEVAAIIGQERQRELLGCNDQSGSCAVEMAGALGTDGLLLGEAAKVGDQYRLSLRIVSSKDGHKLASAVVTGSSEDAVLDAFRQVAPRFASDTLARARGGGTEPAGLVSQRTGTRRFFWVPAVVGALGLGAGALGYVQTKSRYDELRSAPSLVEPRPSQLRNEGQSWQTVGLIGVSVGLASLAAAGGLYALGSDATVEAGVVLAPTGGSIGIAGVLP